MKATIEFEEELYRQLKAAAALRGRKVKDLVAEGVRLILNHPVNTPPSQRIQLPLVKSRKPGTLKLTNQIIAEYEAGIDAGNEG